MPESITRTAAEQELTDTAAIVANLLWQDFEPMHRDFIEDINISSTENYTKMLDAAIVLSGSVREFSTADPVAGTYLEVSETYETEIFDGEREGRHLLTLIVSHDAYNFLFTVDLDTGEMGIETDNSRHVMDLYPDRYPAIKNRVVGSLALVAGELF